jgi:uncharacterized protein DUF6498
VNRSSVAPPVDARIWLSTAALVAGNLVPLFGAARLGWSLPGILVMYWIETGVIGPINALKILKAMRLTGSGGERTISRESGSSPWILALGWLAIYEFFWLFLGVLVLQIASGGFYLGASRTAWTGAPLDVVVWGTAGLVGSQLVSFYLDFVRGDRYRRVSSLELLRDPFVRVFVLFGAITLGGIGIAIVGAPIGFLVILVIVKTVLEVRLLTDRPWTFTSR